MYAFIALFVIGFIIFVLPSVPWAIGTISGVIAYVAIKAMWVAIGAGVITLIGALLS